MIPKPLSFLRFPGTSRLPPRAPLEAGTVLAGLPVPVLVLDDADRLVSINPAGEQFFQAGAKLMLGLEMGEHIAPDSPIFAFMERARASDAATSEYAVEIDLPRLGPKLVTLKASPLPENPGYIVLTIIEMSMAQKIDRQLTHRNAARSVTAMAAMLAHEVKNPLSGIRGAAQLLEETVPVGDRELTRLICDETDRIVALVDRMDMFSDAGPLDRQPINIHQVMERVRKAAGSGFARHVRIIEEYDPSLPMVFGNRDMLVQVFLNLVKNAAEAVPTEGGEITLSTSYQHGIRLAVSGSENRVHLPLVVSVQDNGKGIPEELGEHLFDPFVTTKHNGTGLGLALVAKVVGDHGGVVEFESQPRRTVFRVRLPMAVEIRR